jgi:hypothetical protein
VYYLVIPVVVLVLMVALVWDIWTPVPDGSDTRRGAFGVVLSVLLSCVASIALLVAGPGVLVFAALGLSVVLCVAPLADTMSFARRERARARELANSRRPQEQDLPRSLIDADDALKSRYDTLVRRLEANSCADQDPMLIEEARLLAQELRAAAIALGASRASEMSRDVPALTYWAADIARRSYPAGDERRLQYERSLQYYANFENTAWLWTRYQSSER